MALIISDATLKKSQLSAEELLVDLACYLYDKQKLSMGQARGLADMNQLEFQQALAAREIDIHYTEDDLNKDLKNLGISL